ncbi:MAG TPA: hypothetical protein PLW32_08710 [Chitinophagaceae bacterium]|jgi:hypothetical protein|nr:hypothetical protein [Chitinophagaceae bacterium]
MDAFCKSKGAIYLHSFPVFERTLYNKKWEKGIRYNLSGIKIINTPERYLFNVDSLFDTENHLQYQYRDIRSQRLVEDLRQYFTTQHSTLVY